MRSMPVNPLSEHPAERPYVVYWTHTPYAYIVDCFQAFARRGPWSWRHGSTPVGSRGGAGPGRSSQSGMALSPLVCSPPASAIGLSRYLFSRRVPDLMVSHHAESAFIPGLGTARSGSIRTAFLVGSASERLESTQGRGGGDQSTQSVKEAIKRQILPRVDGILTSAVRVPHRHPVRTPRRANVPSHAPDRFGFPGRRRGHQPSGARPAARRTVSTRRDVLANVVRPVGQERLLPARGIPSGAETQVKTPGSAGRKLRIRRPAHPRVRLSDDCYSAP